MLNDTLQNPWSFVEPAEAFRRALKLASLLGCPTKGATKEDRAKFWQMKQ